MNRRTFFGAVAGGVAAATIGPLPALQPATPFTLLVGGKRISLADAGSCGDWRMASYFNGTTFAEVKWKPGENCILIDWLKYGGDAKGPDLAMECDAEFCLDYNLTF